MFKGWKRLPDKVYVDTGVKLTEKQEQLLRASEMLHQLIQHKVNPKIEPPVTPYHNVQVNIRMALKAVIALYQEIYGADISAPPRMRGDSASKPSSAGDDPR